MERQLAKSDQSTDSVTGMIVGSGYIQCTRGSYQGGDFEEILMIFFFSSWYPRSKNNAKSRVKMYHGNGQQGYVVPDIVNRSYLYSSAQRYIFRLLQLVVFSIDQVGKVQAVKLISMTKLLELIRCYCISRQVFKGTGSVVILGQNYVYSAYMPLAFELNS